MQALIRPRSGLHHLLERPAEVACLLKVVRQWIEGARAQLLAVALELAHGCRAVHRSFLCMVEDRDAPESQERIADQCLMQLRLCPFNNALHYCFPIG